jgi:hypothetical protein
MKKQTSIVRHPPIINLRVLTKKDSTDNIIGSQLILMIDTNVDDLNRTVTNYTIEQPHLFNLSLEIEGFDNYKGSEIEKFVTGQVFLVGARNNVNSKATLEHDHFKILLAEPKFLVSPDKTNKKNVSWHNIDDVKQDIKIAWLYTFSSVLSGYLVESYNQFNAQSIKNVVLMANDSTDQNLIASNMNAINKKPSNENLIKNFLSNTKALTTGAVIVGGVSLLLLSYNMGTSKNQQALSSAPNNSIQSGNLMSVEEVKKAQLRELGINPDDLAADLGCFVE